MLLDSDRFEQSSLAASYARVRSATEALLQGLSAEEKDAILSTNPARLLGM